MSAETHSGTFLFPWGRAFGLLLLASCAAEQLDPGRGGVSQADASLESSPALDAGAAQADAGAAQADAGAAQPDAGAAQPDAGAAQPDAKAAQTTDAASADANPADASNPQSGPTFSAKLQGDQVVLSISGGPVHFMSCTDAIKLEKPDGSGWTTLRDDRSGRLGFFLDGDYVPPQINPGCDFSHCVQATNPFGVGLALEYVQTGTRPLESSTPAPPAGITAANPASDVKTQPYTGKLRVSLIYTRDAQCETHETVQVELEVPLGQLLPRVDLVLQHQRGRLGGLRDECGSRAFRDGYFTPAKDAHGCDVLRTSTSSGAMCCGCARPAAGAP